MSEAATHMQVTRNHLTEVALVSAYDLHHGLLPDVDELFGPNHWESIWATPQLLVIDSGGYELGKDSGESELQHEPRPPIYFDQALYESLVSRLPQDRDFLVVTWDHVAEGAPRPTFDAQAQSALSFAHTNEHLMVDILLKPSGRSPHIRVNELMSLTSGLAFADVIGVTEKELGESILDRALNLAMLRHALDDRGVDAPIHVFGVLDPTLVTLYFIAGGELFDGLAWLRYGIHNGITIYRDAAAVLSGDFVSDGPVRVAHQQFRYLSELAELKRTLRAFVEGNENFDVFMERAETFRGAHEMLTSGLASGGR